MKKLPSSSLNAFLFALITILGVVVMIGWYLESPALIQILPSLAPMQFNNALCFVLLGVAGLSWFYRWIKVSSTFLLLGLSLSSLTLFQYVLNTDFGIDLLFFDTNEVVPTAHPGRMAPNSAMGHVFAFVGLGFLFLSKPQLTKLSTYFSAFVLGNGTVALAGYLIDIDGGYNWGRYTQMALHTSLGQILGGLAVGLSYLQIGTNSKTTDWRIAGHVALLVLTVFFIDMQIPLGVAVGLLYLFPVVASWYFTNSNSIFLVAGISTLLISADVVLAPEDHESGVVMFNQIMSVLSTWTVAIFLFILKREMRKVVESGNRFKSVFENSGEGILVVNDRMEIQLANAQVERMFGYHKNELLQADLTMLIPESFRTKHHTDSSKFIEGNVANRPMAPNSNLTGLNKHGKEFPIAVGLSKFVLDGETYVTASISDLTQRKLHEQELKDKVDQLRKAEIKFRGIFDNTFQFIGLLEPDGTLVEANEAALSFGGVTIDQARGQKFWDSPWWSLSKDVNNQVRQAIKKAAGGEFVRFDTLNLGADGTILNVDFSIRPILDENGKVVFLVPEGRDISDRKELEKKLSTSEREFRTIFETIDEGIVYQNIKGEITNANAAAERILGISLEQMQGVKSIDPRWRSICEDGSDFPGEEHPAMIALKTGKEQRNVIQGIFHPGKEDYVWITANSYPVFDEATGEVMQVYSTFEDVTEEYEAKKALKESEKRFHLAVQGSSAGVWDWISIDEKEEWWSPRFYELLGYKEGELEPSLDTFSELVHPEDKELTFKMVERHFKRKTPFSVEYRLKHKSGNYRWFLGTGQATWDSAGKPIRMVGTIVDIHSRKMAEIAEIEHARALKNKNKELQEFTHVASHDLQEPVRTISSFVELFRELYNDKLDDRANEFLDLMDTASKRSQKLIADLLEYSRIGRSEEISEIDLNEVLNEILSDLSVRIKETRATVQIDKLPIVNGYRTELRLLFQNLISNGIKFSRPDNDPTVGISVLEHDTEYEFVIKDNGIGIDEKFYEQIFVVFKRLHGRSEFEGTGIGLAHCKKVVTLHQGKIWVNSKVDTGSEFHFTISKNIDTSRFNQT